MLMHSADYAVRLSVCPSHAGIVSKRLPGVSLSSNILHFSTVGLRHYCGFSIQNLIAVFRRVPLTGTSNTSGVWKIAIFD